MGLSSAQADPHTADHAPAVHDAHSLRFTGYDAMMRTAVRNFWDLRDWRLLKAQMYQESRFDRFAVSPVGAAGVAQIMPATGREIAAHFEWGNFNPHDVGQSLTAAAFYMQQCRRVAPWRSWPEPDRHDAALGCYNAGGGNIRAAARIGAAGDWPAIAAALDRVTGAHSGETKDYVRLTRLWRAKLGDDLAVVCAWTGHRGGCAPSAAR